MINADNVTFDLQNADQPNTITSASVENAKFDYKPGDTPRATATVTAADQSQYKITNEYWQELDENNVPVAAWYSDGGAYSTLPTITAFESGKKYVYGIMLLPKRGYTFGREASVTVNGNTVTAVAATDGYLSLPNIKTITPTVDSHSHSYGTAWKYDGTNHWHECACGNKADTAVHTFKWVTDKKATATEKGSKHEECSICAYRKSAVDIPMTGEQSGTQNIQNKEQSKEKVETPNKKQTKSPNTGNTNNIYVWFILTVCGAAIILPITFFKKKQGKENA